MTATRLPLFASLPLALRQAGMQVGMHEYLGLLEGLSKGIGTGSLAHFYQLARALFVRHESQLDRFDEVFDRWSRGLEDRLDHGDAPDIPEAWLDLKDVLSPEEWAALKQSGKLDDLEKAFRERLAQQKERHQGGSHWIGTKGTSPFGHSGKHDGGMRLAGEGGQRQGHRPWTERSFQNLRDDVELNTRNIRVALRQLRHLTREGRPDAFDLDGTIAKTSRNGGLLDIAYRPERRNRVKVLLLLDVGGSMDEHVHACEQLFSAAKGSFRNLETYYFHNCIYEHVWPDARQAWKSRVPTEQLLRRFGPQYKLIVVGDAAMAPYELLQKRLGVGLRQSGAIEARQAGPRSGLDWLGKLVQHFRHHVWLNPNPDYGWSYFETTPLIRQCFGMRMWPLTIDGLGKAMRALRRTGDTYEEIWTRE